MKYGESAFDILYLLFAVAAGIYLVAKSKTKVGKALGIATLILGLGDSFHLVPRVLNYFIDGDFSVALGVGKLITSITMTLFYVVLFYVWIVRYKDKYNVALSVTITALALLRVVLSLLQFLFGTLPRHASDGALCGCALGRDPRGAPTGPRPGPTGAKSA